MSSLGARALRRTRWPVLRTPPRERGNDTPAAEKTMARWNLRSKVLRLTAFAALLVSFACSSGPMETVEEASEAMSALPPSEPSVPLTAAPHATEEELAQIEQLVRATVPKWHVYASGYDYDVGRAPSAQGGKPYYSHPQEVDRHCQLALIPEGGNERPETWIFLRYEHYWMKGTAYFTDDLKLSVFDVLGILLALEDAGPEPPQLWSRERLHGVLDSLQDESGSFGVLPPAPPDWGVDNHTCTGGPPPIGPRQPPPSTHRPGSSAPPHRSHEWNGPTLPPPPPWNGVLPKDKPVGKYPGWDKPHPGEWPETFRCGGQVWQGYKSDCPDFQPKPIGERWTKPIDELAREVESNAQRNLDLMRTDPHCLEICTAAVILPGLVSALCPTAASIPTVPTRIFALVCAILRYRIVAGGAYLGGALGAGWCKDSFCKTPSGNGG
jgi:hypothetical protein